MKAILTLSVVCTCVALVGAQQSGTFSSSGGAGPLTRSVIATWAGQGSPTSGGVRIDVLVLWRGKPGWPERLGISGMGAGGSEHAHIVKRRGEDFLRLTVDPKTRQVRLGGQELPLGDGNVVLVDDADLPGAAHIVDVLRVDPVVTAERSGPTAEPVTALVKASSALFEFVRCAAESVDTTDAERQHWLALCREMEPRP